MQIKFNNLTFNDNTSVVLRLIQTDKVSCLFFFKLNKSACGVFLNIILPITCYCCLFIFKSCYIFSKYMLKKPLGVAGYYYFLLFVFVQL